MRVVVVGYDGLSPGGNGDELSILLSLWPRVLSNEQTLSFFFFEKHSIIEIERSCPSI